MKVEAAQASSCPFVACAPGGIEQSAAIHTDDGKFAVVQQE
ncbi:MAG: hypothetical protein WCC12_06430 [Anaerolineales bacterium]